MKDRDPRIGIFVTSQEKLAKRLAVADPSEIVCFINDQRKSWFAKADAEHCFFLNARRYGSIPAEEQAAAVAGFQIMIDLGHEYRQDRAKSDVSIVATDTPVSPADAKWQIDQAMTKDLQEFGGKIKLPKPEVVAEPVEPQQAPPAQAPVSASQSRWIGKFMAFFSGPKSGSAVKTSQDKKFRK